MTRKQRFGLVGAFLILFVVWMLWLSTSAVRASEQTVISKQLLTNATASNAAAVVGGPMANCRESAVYVVWGAGVTSGVVTVESAVDQNYTGTWAPLAVVTFAASAPKQDIVQITGVHWSLRTRSSTVVAGGGTVNTWLVCN